MTHEVKASPYGVIVRIKHVCVYVCGMDKLLGALASREVHTKCRVLLLSHNVIIITVLLVLTKIFVYHAFSIMVDSDLHIVFNACVPFIVLHLQYIA